MRSGPDWWALTQDSLNFWWVAGYFALLMVWRFCSVVDMVPLGQAFSTAFPFVVLGAIVCGLLTFFAYIQARLTMYAVATARVSMRIRAR